MWVLIFVVANSPFTNSGAAAVTQEFSSKEKCMVAQQILLQQAGVKNNSVLNNTCVPK